VPAAALSEAAAEEALAPDMAPEAPAAAFLLAPPGRMSVLEAAAAALGLTAAEAAALSPEELALFEAAGVGAAEPVAADHRHPAYDHRHPAPRRHPDGDVGAPVAIELQPEVAMLYMRQLLSLGVVRTLEVGPDGQTAAHADTLQVPIDNFLLLETSSDGQPTPWGQTEGVQIAHKLLLDLLNAALRHETAKWHRTRQLRVGAVEALPLGGWRSLPEGAALQRLVEGACRLAGNWLAQAHQAEGLPVEVLLSCLLVTDTSEIERCWLEQSKHKEDVIAETSERVLGTLLAELDQEIEAGWPRTQQQARRRGHFAQ
jgi:hypothetical protein